MRQAIRYAIRILGAVVLLCVTAVVLFVGHGVYTTNAEIPSRAEIARVAETCISDRTTCPVVSSELPDGVLNAFVADQAVLFKDCQLCLSLPLPTGMSDAVARILLAQDTRYVHWHAAFALTHIKVEWVLSKRDIATWYLNTAWFGKEATGLTAASAFYFRKTPSQLSVEEAATLAALLRSPIFLFKDHGRLVERRNMILSKMVAQGYLGPQLGRTLASKPLKFAL